MDRYRVDSDVRRSTLLAAAAVGLAASIYLARIDTLASDVATTTLGIAAAVASTASVIVRRTSVGAVVVALALTAIAVLLTSDFYELRSVAAAIVTLVAGVVMMAAARPGIDD